MDLKSYTLEELESYLPPFFSNPESTVALSPLRLKSYLNNPRADKHDPVLFELRQGGELLAYRTLLPDCFFDQEGIPCRFSWLSGNWVRPDMRRKGYSTQLLELAEKQWNGHLMYTNYAPVSKAVYDHSGRFSVIASREGKRYYLRSATEVLLGERMGSRGLLRSTDQLINLLKEKRLKKYAAPELDLCRTEKIVKLDEKLSIMLNAIQQNTLFRRDSNIFNWALEFPWITDAETTSLKYHFSYHASRFENILYRFIHPSGKIGLTWFVLHNRVLSVPYLFAEGEELLPCMAGIMVQTMIDKDCTHSTLRNPDLIANLEAVKDIFLSVRKMPQRIFAHEKLLGLLPDGPLIHDGDGDVMFTG